MTFDHLLQRVCSANAVLRIKSLLQLCWVLLILSPLMHGQTSTGTITGRITDVTGAVVPGTTVILTRTDTGLVLKTTTNNDGIYSFPTLQTGPFLVEGVHEGFKAARTTLTLAVAQTAQLDFMLRVGSGAESVTVDSNSSAQLDTQESNLSYTVGAHQVADLPLNGRNPYGLAALSPGIMPGGSFGAGLSTARGAVVAAATNNFQSNGGLGGANEILLDGVSIIVCCQGQPPLTPSVEIVDQFKVITSAMPAQYGRSSGAVLSIVTKTGANRLRGDIYEYFRNDRMDAANYFTKRSGIYPVPGHADFRTPHKFNQFGGFVSGPVVLPKIYDGRDKTFFTFGYEGTRNIQSSYNTTTVPTSLMRQGIFTEAPTPIYNPYSITASGNTYTRSPIPAACNNVTCFAEGRYVSSIDPVAAKLLQFYPEPTASGITNNYSYAQAAISTENQFSFRVDHNFSPNHRSFVRGIRDINGYHQNDIFNKPSGPNAIGQNLRAYLFSVGHTWTVSPTVLLQFNYGFGYQKNLNIPQNFTGYDAESYGFSTSFASQQQRTGLPVITATGLQQIGNSALTNEFEHYTHVLDIAATLQRGSHTLTLGYDGRYILENEQSVSNGAGSFAFDTTLTNGPSPSAAVPSGQSSFDSFAAFLMGAPTNSTIIRQSTVAFTQPYHALFLQDDWRVLPSLTLNLGIRDDIEMGFRERYNRWADFDPNATNPISTQVGLSFTGGAQYLGISGNPGRTWQTAFRNIAPRVGFSYSPTATTVVRGGFGILFLPTSQRVYGAGTIGYSQSTTATTTLNSIPTNTFSNPFPNGVSLPQGSSAGVSAGTGTAITTLLHDTPNPYQQQWNFGIEQQFTSELVFTLNYAGSHGVKLPISGHPNDLNPKYFGSPGDQTQVAYLQTAVANPFYGSVTTGSLSSQTIQRSQLLSAFPQYPLNTAMSNSSVTYAFLGAGSASFNALQAGLTYRSNRGLNGSVFYTWSKLLGNVSDLTSGFLNSTGNPSIQNYYLIKQYERSSLSTDVPHRIVGSALYPLPFGRGQRYGGGMPGWANVLAGGWKLNAIVSIQSGFPLGLTQTGGSSFSGGRPAYVPGEKPLTGGATHTRLGGTGQAQGYFNSSAFRLSRSFEMGDVPRSAGSMRSPLTFQDDMSMMKDFILHDTLALQLRVEAFNFLNRVQFGLPNTTFNSSSFGVITSQANLPRNVQAALKLSF